MLSEKRAKDREEMARQVEQLAERYGRTALSLLAQPKQGK